MKMLKIILWILVYCPCAIILHANAVPLLSTRSLYGEACSKLMKCDSRGWLGCFNGTCDCIKPDEMMYNENLKKCVSKSGERCAFALGDSANNLITEVFGCVPNARCNSEGFCECGNKFYENFNGSCSPSLEYGESCESEAQCPKFHGLHCIKSVCSCEEVVSEFSFQLKDPQCVGLAGSPCINSECTDDANCNANICVCNDQFYADETGKCVPQVEILQNCSADFQCKQKPTLDWTEIPEKLLCLDGICNCDPNNSIYATAQVSLKYSEVYGYNNYDYSTCSEYDEENQNFHGYVDSFFTQCVGLVGSPCIGRLCSPNAFCSFPERRDNFDQRGVCKCLPDFTKSRSRSCASGYDSSCSSSSTCIDGLKCINSKCLCPFETQRFNSTSQMCISRIGGPCKGSSSCGEQSNCQISKSKSGKETGTGHSTCNDGYVENKKGNCEAAYGTLCSSASDCDSIARLQCIDKRCKCRKFAEFDSEVRKCVGLVGAKCDYFPTMGGTEYFELFKRMKCTKNASCTLAVPLPLELPATCMCDPGFKESANYTCTAEANAVNEL